MGNVIGRVQLSEELSDVKAVVTKDIGHGNSSNSREYLDNRIRVDNGFLVSHGIYSGPKDYKKNIVQRLMKDRRIQPFYKGLDDWSEDWSDEQIAETVLAAIGISFQKKESGKCKAADERSDDKISMAQRADRNIPDTASNNDSEKRTTNETAANGGAEKENTIELGDDYSQYSALSKNHDEGDNEANKASRRRIDSFNGGSSQSESGSKTKDQDHSENVNSVNNDSNGPIKGRIEPEAQQIESSCTVKCDKHHQESDNTEVDDGKRKRENNSNERGESNNNEQDICSSSRWDGTSINRPREGQSIGWSESSCRKKSDDSDSRKDESNLNSLRRRSSKSRVNSQNIWYKKYTEWLPYRDCIECPICFLYYPSNINYTRCCLHPICSECFVEIKRPSPHLPSNHDNTEPPLPTDLLSEPACCPFCNQENFGVVYEPPSEHAGALERNDSQRSSGHIRETHCANTMRSKNGHNKSESSNDDTIRTQKLYNIAKGQHNIVWSDDIRPDWEDKLHRAQARAARKATNATIMNMHFYQGLTASGSSHSRHGRSRLRSDAARIQMMEEMMMMEAIRQSLEEEEMRKRS